VETLLLPQIPICGRVLDLCCGTGRLAAELAQRRYRVVGLDSSGGMLSLARRRSGGVPWIRADARNFALRSCFDAATCLFDSVNHLTSLEDLLATFAAVRDCLRPGGLFLFDVNTEQGFRERWVQEWQVATVDGECRLAGAYDSEQRMGTYHFTLRGRGPESWRRAEFDLRERCHSDGEIRGALTEAGFSLVEVCDAVQDLEMDEEVGRDFYLVRRC
jgi:SAM-dependent methyltransferase